jgi:hypothetical protein
MVTVLQSGAGRSQKGGRGIQKAGNFRYRYLTSTAVIQSGI